MKFIKTILAAVTLLGAAFTSTAVAGPLAEGLTMHVDTTAQTFWFTGAAYGTPQDIDGGEGYVSWTYSNSNNYAYFSLSTALFSSNLVNSALFISNSAPSIIIDLYFDGAASDFIEGTSEVVSYASASQAVKNTLASYPTLTLNTGSGYGNIQSVSAVPEPSTYAAIFGATVLAAAVVRRKKRTVSEKLV